MKIEYSGGLDKISKFFNVMERQFSSSEWKYIRNVDENNGKNDKQEMLQNFMRLWCLKESFVKAEGTGIILPLSKISFVCKDSLKTPQNDVVCSTDVTLSNELLKEWSFEESMLDHNHYVSIAKTFSNSKIEFKNEDLNFKFLNIKDLISMPEDVIFSADEEQLWSAFCQKS